MSTFLLIVLVAFIGWLAIVAISGTIKTWHLPPPNWEDLGGHPERRPEMSYIYEGTGTTGIPIATVINGTIYRGLGTDNIPIGVIDSQ